MNLNRIVISIEPWTIRDVPESLLLRIEVKHDGIQHSEERVIRREDFESLFDQVFSYAQKRIKSAIIAGEPT